MIGAQKKEEPAKRHLLRFGAGKEARTPDLNLGKVALYQLSYSRDRGSIVRTGTCLSRQPPVFTCILAYYPDCRGTKLPVFLGVDQVRPGNPQVTQHRPQGEP